MRDIDKVLTTISRAWGKREGYVFFPRIDGNATTRQERARSYREGKAWQWPEDREAIVAWLAKNQDHDVYWCPVLFDGPHRVEGLARDEKCLWADLDEVSPDEVSVDLRPTIAWETSPGRYQALWLMNGVLQGASWAGKENQQLTSLLGADPSGWDTTQLLRIPGWKNHKYAGSPSGKLLWADGPRYNPRDFNDLPDVPSAGDITAVLDDEIDAVDRVSVWSRVRLKVPGACRELVKAKKASGDRSEKLWYLTRCLADAGCTAPEIVAVVRETVWNKFAGRGDELMRLKAEAIKAIAKREAGVTEKVKEEREEERPDPIRLADLVRDYKPPQWLVENIWSVGACGFIAGQPKSYKTWMAMDLAFSIATGTPFLGMFRVREAGKVLYVQEEDSVGVVKVRSEKILLNRQRSIVEMGDDGGVYIRPPIGKGGKGGVELDAVDIDAYVGKGLVVSDDEWQTWLLEQIEKNGYKAVFLDPLMMIAGDVEEFKAQAMTEHVFKPLKQIARSTACAIIVIHHMKKGSTDDGKGSMRGGQRMLGSVANHAWSDDSLYVQTSRGGVLKVERESKHAMTGPFSVTLDPQRWAPTVTHDALDDGDISGYGQEDSKARRPSATRRKVLKAVDDSAGITVIDIVKATGKPYGVVYQHLLKAKTKGQVRKKGLLWYSADE